MTIALSSSCTLCMLLRISSLTGNLSSLTMQDWNMVPVARSYLNNAWENVAGPYVDKLQIKCLKSNCTLTIPHLAGVSRPVHFALLATNRQVSTKEKVARFLEQVTFGPTLEDVNKFNTTMSLNSQFVSWVQRQMDPSIIVPTYHRQYFRERVDNFLYLGMSNRPRNPCQIDSRWTKHSFYQQDYQSIITVTMMNTTSYLFSIGGIPRTVVRSFQGKFDNGTVLNLTTGKYDFGWWTNEYVGGEVYMWIESNPFQLVGGNPPLYLPQQIIDYYKTTIETIPLPARQYFQDVAPAAFNYRGPQFYIGAGIRSTVNISNPTCEKMTGWTGNRNLIGVFPDNDQWYYDARIILNSNTLDQPIADGGGMMGTFCSNVPRNFLNGK